jgi:hypothetical protein
MLDEEPAAHPAAEAPAAAVAGGGEKRSRAGDGEAGGEGGDGGAVPASKRAKVDAADDRPIDLTNDDSSRAIELE